MCILKTLEWLHYDDCYENRNVCMVTIINKSDQGLLLFVILNYTLPQKKLTTPVFVSQLRDKVVSSHVYVVCPPQNTTQYAEQVNFILTVKPTRCTNFSNLFLE